MEQIGSSWSEYTQVEGRSRIFAFFLCPECKNKVTKKKNNGLRQKSCGCSTYDSHVKHGDCKNGKVTRVYTIWKGMKKRCYNKNEKKYKHYGGRGITICEEWLNDFGVFKVWSMKNGYSDILTIDRRNNDGNYCPENCRFITQKDNNRNQSTTKLSLEKAAEIRITYKNGGVSYKELAEKYGVKYSTISGIVNMHRWV